MTNLKLLAAKHVNHVSLRLIFILMALLAVVLGAGAPDCLGCGG